jgi:valyl-tRNA synthetase
MRTEISAATLTGPAADLERLRAATGDLRAAGKVTGELQLAEAEELAVHDVALVTEDAD